jgi:hypothetical protein
MALQNTPFGSPASPFSVCFVYFVVQPSIDFHLMLNMLRAKSLFPGRCLIFPLLPEAGSM